MTSLKPLTLASPILIVGGGGTMGSSTALHLARKGYQDVTVLDVYPIPSAQSAGNDVNKIEGTSLRNPVDFKLSRESAWMWRNDSTFTPYFHRTGRLEAAHTDVGLRNLRGMLEKMRQAGLGHQAVWLDNEADILEKAPHLRDSPIQGWKGIWIEDSGWLAAAKAINSVGEELRRRGVKFAFGASGTFDSLILSKDKTTCLGVRTKDGHEYFAERIILAAGAWTGTLIDLKEQTCAKAWVYAHIQLTPEEINQYTGCPVVYNEDVGFHFEPNERGIIKVCDEFNGWTRYKTDQPFGAVKPIWMSVPRSHAAHPTDTYPEASEHTIKRAIATFLPSLTEKPLFNRSLCWCADTADANLLIAGHPEWKNLVIASGDSGHTFKLLPIIGKYVVELIEGTLQEDMHSAWRWRPGHGDARKSTRRGRAEDLADHPGWKHDSEYLKEADCGDEESEVQTLKRIDSGDLQILALAAALATCLFVLIKLSRA